MNDGGQPEVTSNDSGYDPEYPDALAKSEAEFLKRRRGAVVLAGVDPSSRLGVGVSGGGIRSATFALGFFQALARRDCTKHIDYLSTVSGGGYFGGFFGAFFRRDNISGHEDVKRLLEPKTQSDVLRYLRENGSYLAPAGTDSLLLGAATLFRNWCVVQLLFLSAVFGAFLIAQAMTHLAQFSPPLMAAAELVPIWRAFTDVRVAPSPWFAIVGLAIAFWVTPLTWSYWVIGRDVPAFFRGYVRPFAKVVWTVLLYAVVAAGGLLLAVESPEYTEYGLILAGIAAFALTIGLMAMIGNATWTPAFAFLGGLSPVVVCAFNQEWTAWWVAATTASAIALSGAMLFRELRLASERSSSAPSVLAADGVRELDEDNEGRYELSDALKTALAFSCAVFALASIDTVARWLVDQVMDQGKNLARQGIGFGAFIALASSILRRAWVLLAKPPGRGERPGLPMTLLAGIAAVAAVVGLLLACDAAAYFAVEHLAWSTGSSPHVQSLPRFAGQCAAAIAAVLAMNVILGSSRNLLNASTQLPLYSARIIRAYLGASNPERTPAGQAATQPAAQSHSDLAPANDVLAKGDSTRPSANERRSREIGAGTPSPSAATRVMSGDDIPAQKYWCWDNGVEVAAEGTQPDPYAKGAPLHLVNVTINETVDGRSQIQQGDRKGVGLTVGPGGFSVGIRHHAVFFGKARRSYPQRGWRVFRFEGDPDLSSAPKTKWRRLSPTYWLDRQHVLENFPLDQLSFGQWLGISGAAFSTGLGSRTNLGLSVLAALANVRLGFWWRPGIKTSVPWLHKLGALFWVQTYLFRELLARFPGTSRALWYLSDGGHFENLGGYELIRRRLPHVLLIDSEEDPKSQCASLANLVRKARLDFGAEIEFLEHADEGEWPRFLGSLPDLQRGEWTRDTSSPSGWKLTAAPEGLSRSHAALAQITYRDGSKGWLLYVKPTLTGDEPPDLRNYHLSHPAFPHQPTTDQFFDEAQWESYRFLGQTIAERLLDHDGVLRKFFDRDLPSLIDGRAKVSSSKPVAAKTDAA
jgi:hypothetical protein